MQLHPRLAEIERFLRRTAPDRLADGTRVWNLDALVDLASEASELDRPVTRFLVPTGPRGDSLAVRLREIFGDDIPVESDRVASLWMVESWLMQVAASAGPGEAVVAAPGAPTRNRECSGPGVALLPLEGGMRFMASVAGAMEIAAANPDRDLVPFFRNAIGPTDRDASDRPMPEGVWWGLFPEGRYAERERAATHALMRRVLREADYDVFVRYERDAFDGRDPWPLRRD